LTNLHSDSYFHLWRDTGHFSANPMGVHWTGIVSAWVFVISFGYWTTDFLVCSACWRRITCAPREWLPSSVPFFKMAVPFIVILPGLLGLVLLQNPDGSHRQLVGEDVVKSCAASTTEDKIQDPAGCSTALFHQDPRSRRRRSQESSERGSKFWSFHSYNEALR